MPKMSNYRQGAEGDGIVVASHPRSGTHLVIDLLRRQFSACAPLGFRKSFGDVPYWNLDELVSISGINADRKIARMRHVSRPVLKTHRRPDFFANCQYTNSIVPGREVFARSIMENASKIFVFRNSVDVMKSLYAMVEPEGGAPFGEFIREVRGPLSRVGWWARHLVEWRSAKRTLVISYDKLLHDPGAELERIAQFLGETPIMRSPILPRRPSSLHVERFKRMLSIHCESTALVAYSGRSKELKLEQGDIEFMHGEIARIDATILQEVPLPAQTAS